MGIASEFPVSTSARRVRVVAVGRIVVFVGAFWLMAAILPRTDGRFGLSLRVAALAAGVAFVSALLQLWFAARGRHLARLAMGQLLLDQLIISTLVFLSGGVASGATSLYGLSCLAGGLLLGVPGATASAIAGGVFFSLTVLLAQSGALPSPPDQMINYRDLSGGQTTYYVVINVLVLALVALLVSYLVHRLTSASGELKEARFRVAQAERMAAMGHLAAGLAHEIRNPLSSISGSVQILRAGLQNEEDRELCEIVLREAARLEELVSDMVDLARRRQPDRALTDVGGIATDVVELMRRSGRADGDVQLRRLGARNAWVMADAAQLRQLIWNLVRNAVQASASGGEVRVEIRVAERVRLIVADDGVGIDSEAVSQLFDAFFTTRSQGTGIGLAVVKRIADDHGFAVEVDSSEGKGASFEIVLGEPQRPGSDPAPSTKGRARNLEFSPDDHRGGGPRL